MEEGKGNGLLTSTQERVFHKFRESGTRRFSKAEYKVLARIKDKCRWIIEHSREAQEIFMRIA